MNLDAWLDARVPAAPAALAGRVCAALGALPSQRQPAEDRLFAAGEMLLARLLHDGCGSRAAAHDLLAVDALVTYAFEAAAEHQPSRLEERAAAAMRRISALGLEARA